MSTLGMISNHENGGEWLRFSDLQGDEVILRGGDNIWMECLLGEDKVNAGIHLTRENVEGLVAHLSAWLTTGSLEVSP